MSYDNNNRIALWMNDKRESQKHPHLKGQGEVNGQFWASAWFSGDISDDDKQLLGQILKRYNSKKPFISVSIQPKQKQDNTDSGGYSGASTQESKPDFNHDIPF